MSDSVSVVKKWPSGYFPLFTRVVDSHGKYASKSKAKKSLRLVPSQAVLDSSAPPYALDYFMHEPVSTPDDDIKLTAATSMVQLLVRPGAYELQLIEHSGAVVKQEVFVEDPFANMQAQMFRDGRELYYRPGRWDMYIIKERPYKELRFEGVVMDIGAHIGTFARDALASDAVTQVIAYEPEPMNFALLQKNVQSPRALLVEAAVANDVGQATLFLNMKGEGGGSALHSLHRKASTRVPISVETLSFREELEKYQPNVLKIDVEGAERFYDYHDLPASIHSIGLELDVNHAAEAIVSVIQSQGFKPIKRRVGWSMLMLWER